MSEDEDENDDIQCDCGGYEVSAHCVICESFFCQTCRENQNLAQPCDCYSDDENGAEINPVICSVCLETNPVCQSCDTLYPPVIIDSEEDEELVQDFESLGLSESVQRKNFGYSNITVQSMQIIFKDLQEAVVRFLNEWPYFVACIAMVTKTEVLAAMKSKSLGLVVDHRSVEGQQTKNIRKLKETKAGVQIKHPAPVGITSGDFRKVDTKNETSWMHHKFLVFGDVDMNSQKFRPSAVYSSSANCSANATSNFENSIYIVDAEVAHKYYCEWALVYSVGVAIA